MPRLRFPDERPIVRQPRWNSLAVADLGTDEGCLGGEKGKWWSARNRHNIPEVGERFCRSVRSRW
jgi:hypothetical protein